MDRLQQLSCWEADDDVVVRTVGDCKEELELGSGRTNQNYIVTTRDARYFARIGLDLPFFGVLRTREHEALKAAAAAGVGARVHHIELPDISVVDLVSGRAITEDDVKAASTSNSPLLGMLTDTIRHLHAADVPELLAMGADDTWGGPHFAKWLAFAEEGEYSRVPAVAEAKRMISVLEAVADESLVRAETLRLCHYDLLPDNFVLGPDGHITIVDFEYAAAGQPLFDLAVLAMGASLSADEERGLLSSYLQEEATEAHCRGFAALKALAALRETFWGVTAEISQSSALSPEEAASYVDMNFAKFQEMCSPFQV